MCFDHNKEKRNLNKRLIYAMRNLRWVLLLALAACQAPQSQPDLVQEDTPIPKIDIHAHYRADRSYLPELLDSFNLQPVLVDVGRQDSSLWMSNLMGLKTVFKKYPQFYYCAAFTANGIDGEDYAERVVEQLKQEIADGARMVKVWKNFGMVFKDNSGEYVHIDDARLQPIWDFLIQQGIPVLAHIGEPIQAWQELEDDNPHANYYRNHPEYHAYQHPEIPSWETIQQARNQWLAQNPRLVVVGAHNGSMSHDVDIMAKQLDLHPNFHLEPAARFGDLARQDPQKVRDFIIKYQDRFLYGTDLGTSGEESGMDDTQIIQERQRIAQMMTMHWEFFSSSGPLDFQTGFLGNSYATRGLELPDSVLRKIYYGNAAKILKLPS